MGETPRARLQNLSAENVRRLFDYDPNTGKFTRLVKMGHAVPGSKVGCEYATGIKIRVNKINYQAHRLAWLHHYGEWPQGDIDHKDGNPLNNTISNLRLCDQALNQANRKRSKRNTSGFKGVSFHKATGKWSAAAKHLNKDIHIGLFSTSEEAKAAYDSVKLDLVGDFHRA